ncbi:unnamed protein product [Discosporangium mesarthrocarpum]
MHNADWVEMHGERLRSLLQTLVSLDTGPEGNSRSGEGSSVVPWAWVCKALINTVQRYPSGLTEAVVMAELESMWRQNAKGVHAPGKLQGYLDAQYAPLSDVVEVVVQRCSDELVNRGGGGTTKAGKGNKAVVCMDMYLHQKFKPCRGFVREAGHDLVAPGRKLRLVG